MIVDFPDPVEPTRATDFPAGTVKDKPLRIYFFSSSSKSASYENETFLNSIYPE